jgi:hypothetical protein
LFSADDFATLVLTPPWALLSTLLNSTAVWSKHATCDRSGGNKCCDGTHNTEVNDSSTNSSAFWPSPPTLRSLFTPRSNVSTNPTDIWAPTLRQKLEQYGISVCMLQPGDTIYIPCNYYHATLNVGDTVAVGSMRTRGGDGRSGDSGDLETHGDQAENYHRDQAQEGQCTSTRGCCSADQYGGVDSARFADHADALERQARAIGQVQGHSSVGSLTAQVI